MARTTRIQIFDVVMAHFAFAITKKPFQIIDLKRLGAGLHRGVSAAIVAKLHPLLCPNGRHRVEQFCRAH